MYDFRFPSPAREDGPPHPAKIWFAVEAVPMRGWQIGRRTRFWVLTPAMVWGFESPAHQDIQPSSPRSPCPFAENPESSSAASRCAAHRHHRVGGRVAPEAPGRTVKADGFRPGKVPMSVVAQRYGYWCTLRGDERQGRRQSSSTAVNRLLRRAAIASPRRTPRRGPVVLRRPPSRICPGSEDRRLVGAPRSSASPPGDRRRDRQAPRWTSRHITRRRQI